MLRILRWILVAIRVLTPWIVRLVLFMGRLILTTVASLWVGVPISVERIAHEWMDRAVAVGVPTEYDTVLYWIFKTVGFTMICLGWIGFSYLTVWIFHLIFS